MSRKVILTLATAATIITAGLASSAADARGFGGSGFGGGHFAGGGRVGGGGSSHFARRGGGRTLIPILNPGRPGHGHPGFPGRPGHWAHWHHHHWVFRDGGWIEIDGVDGVDGGVEAPVAPGPCTCLTKTYTPEGLVVFADVCTKEAASARVDGKATDATPVPPVDGKASDATQAPTSPNYAGLTFKDFLAANAQAASQTSQKN
jgi:hypothetical protein